MDKVTSRDGTPIAFVRAGAGHPLIFAVGAFNDHTRCAELAKELETDYTVITYDRRARGESGDTPPYAVEREVEDLAALIEYAGGEAAVFGFSSGGVLALQAAADGVPISHLALYEVPFGFEDGGRSGPGDLPERLTELVGQGRNGDAVELFQTEAIGLPAEVVAQIRHSPIRPGLEAMAQSLVYEATLTRALPVPTAEMAALTTPTMVLNGTETWPFLRESARSLAGALSAEHREVPGGQNHDIAVAATASALREFIGAR
jgi:pimeloyl-ACP methyl ester carboxylesterase